MVVPLNRVSEKGQFAYAKSVLKMHKYGKLNIIHLCHLPYILEFTLSANDIRHSRIASGPGQKEHRVSMVRKLKVFSHQHSLLSAWYGLCEGIVGTSEEQWFCCAGNRRVALKIFCLCYQRHRLATS